jgi:xylitol oxidase
VLEVLPLIEAKLAPFNARPHWAKVSTTSHRRLAELYPRLPEFRQLAAKYDPDGKFKNHYLQSVLGA